MCHVRHATGMDKNNVLPAVALVGKNVGTVAETVRKRALFAAEVLDGNVVCVAEMAN